MADGNAATDVPTMNQTGPNCRLCEMRVKPRRVLALPLDGAQQRGSGLVVEGDDDGCCRKI